MNHEYKYKLEVKGPYKLTDQLTVINVPADGKCGWWCMMTIITFLYKMYRLITIFGLPWIHEKSGPIAIMNMFKSIRPTEKNDDYAHNTDIETFMSIVRIVIKSYKVKNQNENIPPPIFDILYTIKPDHWVIGFMGPDHFNDALMFMECVKGDAVKKFEPPVSGWEVFATETGLDLERMRLNEKYFTPMVNEELKTAIEKEQVSSDEVVAALLHAKLNA